MQTPEEKTLIDVAVQKMVATVETLERYEGCIGIVILVTREGGHSMVSNATPEEMIGILSLSISRTVTEVPQDTVKPT